MFYVETLVCDGEKEEARERETEKERWREGGRERERVDGERERGREMMLVT